MTKEEATKEIRKRHCTENKFCHDECMYSENACPYDMAIEALKEPEQKKGQWVDGESKCPVCGEDKFKNLDADIWADWKPPFCPNCGADMRGEQDDRRKETD